MTLSEFRIASRGLRPHQRDVLNAVAFGDDSCHHPATLVALEKRGLIEHYAQPLGGRFAVTVRRYFMPSHVHIAYCEWCSYESEKAS